jgi:hypothetical protein
MTPRKLNNSLLFSYLFLYLSFFSPIGKEAGRRWEIVQEDVGCTGVTEEAKWSGSTCTVNIHSKNELTHHPTPRTTRPLHHRISQPYLKWVPQLPWGLPKLRV